MNNGKRRKPNAFLPRHAQQFNGREGETATLLFGLSVSLTLRVGGFAPRHLSRSIARGKINAYFLTTTNYE